MTTLTYQIRLLFWRKLVETLRTPAWVVVGLTTPLLYLALFAPLLAALAGGPGFPQNDILDVFLPGILVLMAFGAGMGAGWIVIDELNTGVIERLRVTPASRLALLLGPVLRDVVMFVVPALLVILIAQPFGYHPNSGGVAVLLVLLSLLTALVSAWSNALGMLLKEIGSLAAIITGLQLPLTLLRRAAAALDRARLDADPRTRQPAVLRGHGGAQALRRHDRHRRRRLRLPRDRRADDPHAGLGNAGVSRGGGLRPQLAAAVAGAGPTA
jgi:ABC-2 type transport system permease protein